jgi:hypothetical protein
MQLDAVRTLRVSRLDDHGLDGELIRLEVRQPEQVPAAGLVLDLRQAHRLGAVGEGCPLEGEAPRDQPLVGNRVLDLIWPLAATGYPMFALTTRFRARCYSRSPA